MSAETFDPKTIYCVVKSRLDLGESPEQIFDELKVCTVIDISALRAVMKEISPDIYPERRTSGLTRGTLHQFVRRTGTDGR